MSLRTFRINCIKHRTGLCRIIKILKTVFADIFSGTLEHGSILVSERSDVQLHYKAFLCIKLAKLR